MFTFSIDKDAAKRHLKFILAIPIVVLLTIYYILFRIESQNLLISKIQHELTAVHGSISAYQLERLERTNEFDVAPSFLGAIARSSYSAIAYVGLFDKDERVLVDSGRLSNPLVMQRNRNSSCGLKVVSQKKYFALTKIKTTW